MTLFVEFTDSEVGSVKRVGSQLHIRLAAATAVQVDGDGPSMHGHALAVEWVLHDALVEGSLHDLVGRIATGRAECAGRWTTRLALPSHITGSVRIELTFANLSSLAASGTALECRVDGAPRFTESMAC